MITKETIYKRAFENKSDRLKQKQKLREAALKSAYMAEKRLGEIDLSLSQIGSVIAITALSGNAQKLEILKNQARYVKPGGVLVYSTCTLVRAENEGVLEAFLAENSDFQLEPLPLPAVFPQNESGMLLLVPGQYDTDGFFISRLRRIK